MIPFSCGFECDPAKLMSRLNIQPHDLQATWAQAHKDPSFGVPLFDMPEFFKPSRWREAFHDVQQGIKETKQVHAASQKLGTMVFETVSNLGESNELEDIQSAILPLLHQIHEEAKTDAGVRMLCSSLKTDAITKIFPPAAMDTLTSFYGASTQSVHASIEESPPPPMDGVDVTDQTFEIAKEAKLEHARAAFGAVMGTSEERRRWVRRRRRSTAFGGFADAVRWLRDSVLSTIQRVWKHVGRFALVAVMVAAVILTYCAIMGRDYESDVSFVRFQNNGATETIAVHQSNIRTFSQSFGIAPLIPAVLAGGAAVATKIAVVATFVEAHWATLAVLSLLGAGVAKGYAGSDSNFTAKGDELPNMETTGPDTIPVFGQHTTNQPAYANATAINKDIFLKAVASRRYKSGMCSYLWACMDSIVSFLTEKDQPWIARTVDDFFQKKLVLDSAEQGRLFRSAKHKTFVRGLKVDQKSWNTFMSLTDADRIRLAAEREQTAAFKSSDNRIVELGAAYAKDNEGKKRLVLNAEDKAINFVRESTHSTDFNPDTDNNQSLESNARFAQQLEAHIEWSAITDALKKKQITESEADSLKTRLLESSKQDLVDFMALTSEKTMAKATRIVGWTGMSELITANAEGKLLKYIDDVHAGEYKGAVLQDAAKHVRMHAVGLSSYFSAMRNMPGLSIIGDALGVNAHATEQSKNAGVALIAGVFLAWYLMGPMLASVLIIAIGAGFVAHGSGAMGMTNAVMLAIGIFAGLWPLVPDVTSDQAATINALLQISAQTSADIRQFRVQNAHEQYAQASARAAADAARHGAFASVAAGIAAGVATQGNPSAMSAAASAGSNLVSGLSRHREIEAQQRLYDQTRNFFGEFV